MGAKGFAAVFLSVAVCAQAQTFLPPADQRVVRGFLSCTCSPSSRGVTAAALSEMRAAQHTLLKQVEESRAKGSTGRALLSENGETAKRLYASIKKKYGVEAAANADAKLRSKTTIPICSYDKVTGWNLRIFLGEVSWSCLSVCRSSKNPIAVWSSYPIRDCTSTASSAPKASSSSSPIPTPSAISRASVMPSTVPTSEDKERTQPQAEPSSNSDSAADAPSSSSSPIPTPSAISRAPVMPSTVPTSEDKERTQPQAEPSSNSDSAADAPSATTAPQARNEGCVAVEHLQGHVLQHRRHLLRPVLCSKGFCATPNHGIIVDGEYTSMKKLCSTGKWSCIRQTKWVNNLKLAASRRAVISDSITVTPYDVRFPRAATWAVQMLEDAWSLLSSSLLVGLAAAVFSSFLPCVCV